MDLRLGWAVCMLFVLFVAPLQIVSAAPQAAGPTAITVSPAKLEFDPQPVSVASSPKVITLVNGGGTALTITDVLTSGIDFSESNHCGTTLASGASCTVEVSFKPAIIGPRLGTLIIAASDAGSPHMVSLAGTGQ